MAGLFVVGALPRFLTARQLQSVGAGEMIWPLVASSIQLALCLAIVVGIPRLMVYSLFVLSSGVSSGLYRYPFFAQSDLEIAPLVLGGKINQDIVVLGAMIALVLLIRRDHFSLGGWLSRRGGWRIWH